MEKCLTQISKISSKYQTGIPAMIRKELKIETNGELVWQIIKKGKTPFILVAPKPQDWSIYLSGLGKDLWAGINTDDYINQLRDEWQK